MQLSLLAFLFGILTIASPCVLPILPVILGKSATSTRKLKPLIITLSFAVSAFVFTFLLKLTTDFIGAPEQFLRMFAGVIVLALGVHFLFPEVWEYISGRLNLASRSGQTLQTSAARDSYWGDVVVGLALGPVLNSCSPTYLLIVGVILPQDLAVGTVHLLFYTLGLALALLAIGLLGQRVATKLRWMADPHGRFRIIVGTVLVLFGVLILSGVDKVIESYLIENQSGFYQVLVNFEVDALESL